MSGAPPLPALGVTVRAACYDEAGVVPEQDLLSPAALPERRLAFVAGRLAARRALAAEGVPLEGLRVERLPSGAPEPRVRGRALPLRLSVTHARPYALAAVGPAPLGIDLVERPPPVEALSEDVFAPEERRGLVAAWGGDPEGADAFAFAAKECALKWLGTGMGVPLRRVTLAVGARDPRPPGATRVAVTLTHPRGRCALTLDGFAVGPRHVGALLR